MQLNLPFRKATLQDLPSIQAIMNDAILHSTAIYDYYERDETFMQNWFQLKQSGNWPVVVVEVDNQVVGFGTYGPFRPHNGFVHTVEHSLYLSQKAKGKGLGLQLLNILVEYGKNDGKKLMVGCIDAENKISIHLHQKCGFSTAGTLHKAGYKFNKWLDLVFMEKELNV